MESFTGIEPILDWLEQMGLLDVLTEIVTEFSVEALITLLGLAIGLVTSAAVWGVILVIGIIVAIVTAVVVTVLFVLRAIGLMRMAKKLGVKHRWLAWIPYAYTYLLGACAEKSLERQGKKPWKWSLILLLVTLGVTIGQPIVQLVVGIVLSVLPVLSVAVNLILEASSLILLVMMGYCLSCVYMQFAGKAGGIVLGVIAALLGWAESLITFIVGFLRLRRAEVAVQQDE